MAVSDDDRRAARLARDARGWMELRLPGYRERAVNAVKNSTDDRTLIQARADLIALDGLMRCLERDCEADKE